MSLKSFILRKFKKIIQRKDFWFAIVIYPLLLWLYSYLKTNLVINKFVTDNALSYFIVFFCLAIFTTFLVAWEIFEKKIYHKVQGQKLQFKKDSVENKRKNNA